MSAAVLTNARIATMVAGAAPYGLVEGGAIVVTGDRITWAGPAEDMPAEFARRPRLDVGGRLVTPGLIDCHTHLVHGGDRAGEFEMRLEGASYEEVARAGGGIISTVRATRAAGEEELVATALPRLDALIAEGVTTVEVKSGYGLDVDTEVRMLTVARRLAEQRPVTVIATYLGAHAVPPEYAGRADAYVDEICIPLLARLAADEVAHHVDAFCEGIGFTPDQVDRLFAAAREHGFGLKLHAEQLSNLGGAALAAGHGALSADHLEYLDQAGVEAMAAAGTVAVLLPGAFYTIRETQAPPVAALREAGFSDRDIWDIANVAGFFNMTNRVASATDMRPNDGYHAQAR